MIPPGFYSLTPAIGSLPDVVSSAINAMFDYLAQYKDGLSALETICKIAALIVGAIWAWKGFIRNRLRFPSATLEHVITSWADEDRIFLRVKVRIANTGNVLIKLSKGKTWLEKLTPLPSKVRTAVRAGTPIQKGKHEISWSLIQKHELGANVRIQIEPKESDELNFDFVIDKRISRILVYTHLENEAKGLRRKIGWNLTSVYAITPDNNIMQFLPEQDDERQLPDVDPEDLPRQPIVEPVPPKRIQSPEKPEPEPDED